MIITTITRPNLTPEEREARMNEIKKAAVELVIAVARAKKEKEKNNEQRNND